MSKKRKFKRKLTQYELTVRLFSRLLIIAIVFYVFIEIIKAICK